MSPLHVSVGSQLYLVHTYAEAVALCASIAWLNSLKTA